MIESIKQLSDALATLIWPVLAVVIVWRLYPTIQRIIASRAFTVKMGGFEFTAQEATDKLIQSTAELQSRIAALDKSPSLGGEELQRQIGTEPRDGREDTKEPTSRNRLLREVLWVDDIPDRHAYEIAQLEALGVKVTITRSSRAALDLMNSRTFDAVVTSLSRSEEGAYSPTAGLSLLESAKEASFTGSVYVFTANPAPQLVTEVDAAGGRVVMTSMQLFDALWENDYAEPRGAKTIRKGSPS